MPSSCGDASLRKRNVCRLTVNKFTLWRQMYHVVNHATYHRGQLTTMLRQLQTVPVATDFLVFHDELESPPV